MIIRNETRKTVLSTNAIKAATLKQKTFGLILAKKGTAMIFQTRFGIHTFFMSYPIDVLILDKENNVVAMKENLKPNTVFVWNIKYKLLIEFPHNSLSGTKIGEHITFNHK